MLATLEALKLRLGIDHDRQDKQFTQMLAGISAAVETYLERKIEAADYTERYNGNGKDRLVLNPYPVQAVTSVRINGRAADGWDFDDWLLMRPHGFDKGLRNVEVRYRAGYETVPADIAEAVLEIAMQRINEAKNGGIQSKTLAGETITFATFAQSAGMPPAAYSILQQYRRKAA